MLYFNQNIILATFLSISDFWTTVLSSQSQFELTKWAKGSPNRRFFCSYSEQSFIRAPPSPCFAVVYCHFSTKCQTEHILSKTYSSIRSPSSSSVFARLPTKGKLLETRRNHKGKSCGCVSLPSQHFQSPIIILSLLIDIFTTVDCSNIYFCFIFITTIKSCRQHKAYFLQFGKKITFF